ncbi:MAG: hypothetical protein ACE5JO_10630 [Candidatus Binatia bacterium]
MATLLLNRDIERFKAQLERTATEHQVRFTKLHETRAEVIAELYKRLAQAQRCFASLINPMQSVGEPPIEEKRKSAQDAGNAFVTYFDENEIYLDPRLCQQIDEFNKQLRESFLTFFVYVLQDPKSRIPDHTKKWHEAWNKLNDDIPPIREEIANSFRQILGVS